MKCTRESVFRYFGDISPEYILEAAPDTYPAVSPGRTGRSTDRNRHTFASFMRSGWGVAAVCILCGGLAYALLLSLGNGHFPGISPSGHPTKSETTVPEPVPEAPTETVQGTEPMATDTGESASEEDGYAILSDILSWNDDMIFSAQEQNPDGSAWYYRVKKGSYISWAYGELQSPDSHRSWLLLDDRLYMKAGESGSFAVTLTAEEKRQLFARFLDAETTISAEEFSQLSAVRLEPSGKGWSYDLDGTSFTAVKNAQITRVSGEVSISLCQRLLDIAGIPGDAAACRERSLTLFFCRIPNDSASDMIPAVHMTFLWEDGRRVTVYPGWYRDRGTLILDEDSYTPISFAEACALLEQMGYEPGGHN